MNLKYRNQRNAEAVAGFWGRSADDRFDWYAIKAQGLESTEILIYDIIGWPFNDAGELVRALAGLDTKEIVVRINSPGGDIFDGFAIFNALSRHKARIITQVEALAASAASVLMMAGTDIQACRNAMTMIHNPWAVVGGDDDALRDVADVLAKIKGSMIDIYADRSGTGKREIKTMMKAETWMTAKEAKDKGFVDTIIDSPAKAKAEWDLSMFANAPDEYRRTRDDELTERDAEKALRDAGFSRSKAKALLAGRQQMPEAAVIQAVADVAKNTLSLFQAR